jgi:hypothetical protein
MHRLQKSKKGLFLTKKRLFQASVEEFFTSFSQFHPTTPKL